MGFKTDSNNWDRESERLFSRIKQQRKADKLNQYRGGKMEFSEELKQIVRKEQGVWNGCECKYCHLLSSGGVCYSDTMDIRTYTRPEFEACLMQMTGRPKVEDWPKWAQCAAMNNKGVWFFCSSIPEHGQCVFSMGRNIQMTLASGEILSKNYVITRSEALERERIIKDCSIKDLMKGGFTGASEYSSEVELQYLGEANKIDMPPQEAWAKVDEITRKSLMGDCDWFRKGDTPPIGEAVTFDDGKHLPMTWKVISSHKDEVWLVNKDDQYASMRYTELQPADFDIGEIHQEAIEQNDFKSQVSAIEMLVSTDKETYPLALALSLYINGCRIHPELAE